MLTPVWFLGFYRVRVRKDESTQKSKSKIGAVRDYGYRDEVKKKGGTSKKSRLGEELFAESESQNRLAVTLQA
jgi:hypothetical protein